MTVVRADRPAYRITPGSSFFGPDCHLYKEGDAFYFDGTPHEGMEPLNDIAREKLRAYIEQLEAGEREVAQKNGRNYFGRSRSVEERLAQASTDAKQVQLIQGGPGIPVMGGERDTSSIAPVGAEEVQTAKRGPGRPRKSEQIAGIA